MRIGIIGGSFNPPHKGHMHIAMVARRILRLDRILFIPTTQNPWKSDTETMPFQSRISLLREMISPFGYMYSISEIEKKMKNQTTQCLIRYMAPRLKHDKLFFIGGTDILPTFHMWEGWTELVKISHFVFVERDANGSFYKHLNSKSVKYLHNKAKVIYNLSDTIENNMISIIRGRKINISSTDIRNRSASEKRNQD